jgi:2-amino-4-hydroxy-6-hydroxymethyldihydropteridine diphosphokinase
VSKYVLTYLGLGGNIGDVPAAFAAARARLGGRMSSVRKTAPVGPVTSQPDYWNAVLELEWAGSARALLDELLSIERSLGRVRTEPGGPRTIDLDLLLFGDEQLDEPGLVVPHPRMHERIFVLEPLVELAPEIVIPGRGRAADLLVHLRAWGRSG